MLPCSMQTETSTTPRSPNPFLLITNHPVAATNLVGVDTPVQAAAIAHRVMDIPLLILGTVHQVMDTPLRTMVNIAPMMDTNPPPSYSLL